MTFIEDQAKKEIAAAKRVWRVLLYCFAIFWGFTGLGLLFTKGWVVGVILLGAAGYIYYRLQKKHE